MFSIIIPTFNNLDYLKLCIKSIRQNSKYSHQILLASPGCCTNYELNQIQEDLKIQDKDPTGWIYIYSYTFSYINLHY